jgi:hypothetical protein
VAGRPGHDGQRLEFLRLRKGACGKEEGDEGREQRRAADGERETAHHP